jgi:crossover junction endonuclease MUS81
MASEGSANPQLLGWVKEWLDVARERNSKGVTTYRNAYESLKACPIVFQHPSQLQQLRGFGPKLCDRLTDKLKKHCEEAGILMPEDPRISKKNQDATEDAGDGPAKPAKKPRKAKAYVPAYRSGAYALVLALSNLDEEASTGMTKSELIEIAQPHCDSSFTAPSDPTKFYTAWNSMKTLVQKELVFERGRPLRRYALTDEGWEVAKRVTKTAESDLQADLHVAGPSRDNGIAQTFPAEAHQQSRSPTREPDATNLASNNEAYAAVVADSPEVSTDSALPSFTPIRLPPGSFSVHMLLDVREVRAKTDRDYMQEELAKRGTKPIMRSLELGDVQWVAKCHDSAALSRHGSEGDEVVLDWIGERKRLDDLISSIKDGRFHEQKFRLKRSGVQNVIYIVEEISMDALQYQKSEEAVQSAIASTQVVNGYFLKRTQKIDETIRYLARMTTMLKRLYESKTLHVIPSKVLTAQNYLPLLQHLRTTEPTVGYYISYPAFASLASKSEMMTLRDIYLKMLMNTRGITGEKALEIQKRWKTPYDFVMAFQACGTGEQGKKRKIDLVATQMNHLIARKKIGKAVCQRIAEVWGDA